MELTNKWKTYYQKLITLYLKRIIMEHKHINLKSITARVKHFQPNIGRPSDDLIVKTIVAKVDELISTGDTTGQYISTELCSDIWAEYENQHVYIGGRIRLLIGQKMVPLIKAWVGKNNHVHYEIKPFPTH